jgi:hypothetical protein
LILPRGTRQGPDPEVLAALARTSMQAKHDDLVAALDGMFDDHHGELAGQRTHLPWLLQYQYDVTWGSPRMLSFS